MERKLPDAKTKKPPDIKEAEFDAISKKKGRKPTLEIKKQPDKAICENIENWIKKPPDKVIASWSRMAYQRSVLSGRYGSFRGNQNKRKDGCSEPLEIYRVFRMKEVLKIFMMMRLKVMLNFKMMMSENEDVNLAAYFCQIKNDGDL
ncbi:MAG: hypothetical protein Ta2E_08850 [Mycoplasmoidaceae bacterium]|nr:MAG: hypothetical protein Ta2E_08850 [Mycoplasmoidaceae bacterium]